jgi:hypothetical protein
MKFFSREDALSYWLAADNMSGGVQIDFNTWVDTQKITWLNEEDQEFIRSFE